MTEAGVDLAYVVHWRTPLRGGQLVGPEVPVFTSVLLPRGPRGWRSIHATKAMAAAAAVAVGEGQQSHSLTHSHLTHCRKGPLFLFFVSAFFYFFFSPFLFLSYPRALGSIQRRKSSLNIFRAWQIYYYIKVSPRILSGAYPWLVPPLPPPRPPPGSAVTAPPPACCPSLCCAAHQPTENSESNTSVVEPFRE